MTYTQEIVGVRKIALYVNEDVRFRFPDPSKENEIDLIAHATGSVVVDDAIELPKWEREVGYSANYKQNYLDTFSFLLHGIENDVPEIIKSMRNNRKGYIVEIITTGGKSFVFPSPVFLSNNNTKQIDSHTWNVELKYRVQTFKDKYTKLNTIFMVNSYIATDNNTILGGGLNTAIVGN